MVTITSGIERWVADEKRKEIKEEPVLHGWTALVQQENGSAKQVYLGYLPFPKQRQFHASPAKYRLFGGAAGPGKSKALLMEAVLQAHDNPGANTLLLRRTFAELEQSLLLYFRRDVPRDLYKSFNESKHLVTWWNGSTTWFGYCQRESDVYQYQGAEFLFIGIDELTLFTLRQWQFLTSRNRCPAADSFPCMAGATNPGNIGHAWVKALWIDRQPAPGMEYSEEYDANDYEFIPARITDNPIYAGDQQYLKTLGALPSHLKRAFLDGDWNVFAGQYFDRFDWSRHVARAESIDSKPWWPRWISIDWGFEHPAAVYWHAQGEWECSQPGIERNSRPRGKDVLIAAGEEQREGTGQSGEASTRGRGVVTYAIRQYMCLQSMFMRVECICVSIKWLPWTQIKPTRHKQMQAGRIYRPNGTGNWYLRYIEEVIDPTGKVTKRKAFKKLADYGDEYKTEKSVQPLADVILAPINVKAAPVESVMTVADFFEYIFLPERAAKLKPATETLYTQVCRLMKPHLGNITLRDFRVSDATRVLEAISRTESGEPTSHGVNRHNKSILSAVFKYARQTDRISQNPIRDAVLPQGKPVETFAYSLDEVSRILKAVTGTCRALVATAAYSGLRISEIRGLRWQDITNDAIYVRRSVWNRKIGDVKREASGAPVPLMAKLKRELAAHHKRNPHTEWVFQNRFGRPLQTNYCSLRIRDKAEAIGIKWFGWHAFRRGLATNLHDAGVDDLTVAGILRHADVSTTRACYIKRLPAQSIRAMRKLERRF